MHSLNFKLILYQYFIINKATTRHQPRPWPTRRHRRPSSLPVSTEAFRFISSWFASRYWHCRSKQPVGATPAAGCSWGPSPGHCSQPSFPAASPASWVKPRIPRSSCWGPCRARPRTWDTRYYPDIQNKFLSKSSKPFNTAPSSWNKRPPWASIWPL